MLAKDNTSCDKLVSGKHFASGLKLGDYIYLGVLNNGQAYFTYRHAFEALGGDDSIDNKLAEQTICKLKQKYPGVFSEPVLPIEQWK